MGKAAVYAAVTVVGLIGVGAIWLGFHGQSMYVWPIGMVTVYGFMILLLGPLLYVYARDDYGKRINDWCRRNEGHLQAHPEDVPEDGPPWLYWRPSH